MTRMVLRWMLDDIAEKQYFGAPILERVFPDYRIVDVTSGQLPSAARIVEAEAVVVYVDELTPSVVSKILACVGKNRITTIVRATRATLEAVHAVRSAETMSVIPNGLVTPVTLYRAFRAAIEGVFLPPAITMGAPANVPAGGPDAVNAFTALMQQVRQDCLEQPGRISVLVLSQPRSASKWLADTLTLWSFPFAEVHHAHDISPDRELKLRRTCEAAQHDGDSRRLGQARYKQWQFGKLRRALSSGNRLYVFCSERHAPDRIRSEYAMAHRDRLESLAHDSAASAGAFEHQHDAYCKALAARSANWYETQLGKPFGFDTVALARAVGTTGVAAARQGHVSLVWSEVSVVSGALRAERLFGEHRQAIDVFARNSAEELGYGETYRRYLARFPLPRSAAAVLSASTHHRLLSASCDGSHEPPSEDKALAAPEDDRSMNDQSKDPPADDVSALKAKLADTIRKLKLERAARAADSKALEEASARLAYLERQSRIAAEAAAGVSDASPVLSKIARVEQIRDAVLDPESVRARIARYHATLDKKGYDQVWRERIEAIDEVISRGETHLARALSVIRGNEERRRGMGLSNRRWVVDDRYLDLPWQPAAAAYRSTVFEAVLAHVRADTTKIIETGSGWGEHLCNIFLNGGPVDATYYACELEEEGRKCALMLAALEPLLRMEAMYFDYTAPDFSGIPQDRSHTVLLTAHSIEQVSRVHPDFISGALSLGQDVTGIHVEPVGWQMQPETDRSEVSQSHHARCRELRYNENLWELLLDNEEKGRIRIVERRPNLIGLDYNPASLIIWQKT